MLPQDLLKDHLEAWLRPQAEKTVQVKQL